MTATYVLTTSIGQVRLLIPDSNIVTPVFTDEEITAMLLMENSRVKRGAALCLETMASSEAYVQKAIRLLDLSTDGPKVAAELRARAKTLRGQDADDLTVEQAVSGEALFEVAEWPLGPPSARDYLDRRYWSGE